MGYLIVLFALIILFAQPRCHGMQIISYGPSCLRSNTTYLDHDMRVVANQKQGLLHLCNVLPSPLYNELHHAYVQDLATFTSIPKRRCDTEVRTFGCRRVGKRLKSNVHRGSRYCGFVGVPEPSSKIWSTYLKLRQHIFSTTFERKVFEALKMRLPEGHVQRDLRLQVERYGLSNFRPGVPHTDRVLWQATLQVYIPVHTQETTSSLVYGTCFHSISPDGLPIKDACEVKIRYERNSGFFFKTSSRSFHSSPVECFDAQCCKETRFALLVNWAIDKSKLTLEQKVLDNITIEKDYFLYRSLIRTAKS